jgi:hypothetical protein
MMPLKNSSESWTEAHGSLFLENWFNINAMLILTSYGQQMAADNSGKESKAQER